MACLISISGKAEDSWMASNRIYRRFIATIVELENPPESVKEILIQSTCFAGLSFDAYSFESPAEKEEVLRILLSAARSVFEAKTEGEPDGWSAVSDGDEQVRALFDELRQLLSRIEIE
jgi:hypothetical protein